MGHDFHGHVKLPDGKPRKRYALPGFGDFVQYIIYDMTLYDHIMDPNGDCVWFMMLFSPDGLISNDPIGI